MSKGVVEFMGLKLQVRGQGVGEADNNLGQ